MLTQQTVIDQIEIDRFGNINVRFAKEIVNGDVVVAKEWHRTSFPPGTDIDAQLSAVDASLEQLGSAKTDRARVSELKAVVGLIHTPDSVEAYREKLRQAEDAVTSK